VADSVHGRFSKVTTAVLWVLFVIGTAMYFILPWWTKQYLEWRHLYSPLYFQKMLIVLYPAGLCAIIMTFFTIRLLMNVNQNKAFIPANAKLLRGISICAFIMSAIFLAAVGVLQSVFVFFMFIIFAIVGLVSFILSGLFNVALKFKEENELTI
jgi:hypothetical protein